MREILFRGKAIAVDRFVEGSYYHQTEFYGDECDEHYIISSKDVLEDNMICCDEVIPSTVGQYTGLTDKNGKKIFEGDIIQRLPKYKTDTVETYEVIFLEGSFQYACLGKKYCYSFDDSEFGICSNQYEVIGNIHDNPELLGDK